MTDQQKIEILRKALESIQRQYAHCNCPADDAGRVRYHSNCQRHMKPIIEKALEETV